MTNAQLALLQTELETDPASMGYAAPLAAGDHSALAALLNTVRTGVAVAWLSDVSADALRVRVAKSEYLALSANERAYLDFLLGGEVLDTTFALLRTELAALFAAGSTTRAAWLAVAQRQPTRVEEVLSTMGIVVTHTDVSQALSLP